jgi:hypothetical protein
MVVVRSLTLPDLELELPFDLEASPKSFGLTFRRTIKLFLPASDLDFGTLKHTIRLLVLALVPELEGLSELFSALDFGRILVPVLVLRMG